MIPHQLFFPWQGTIRRLELGKRWWHRLAVVVFFTVLIAVLLCTLAVMMDAASSYDPIFDNNQIFQSWYVDGSGAKVYIPPPPSGPAAIRLGTAGEIVPIPVEVPMPDGEIRDFVGKSREEIRAAWDAEVHKIKARRWFLVPTVTILVTLAMSYLLQSLYRLLLYVVYGSQKHVAV